MKQKISRENSLEIGKTLNKKRVNYITIACQVIVGILLILFIIVPLFRMFLFIDSKAIKDVFSSSTFFISLKNSLILTSIATLISVVIAYCLAWAINRTSIYFKRIFYIFFILPMLIPSISQGMGLIVLFGNNGVITKMLNLTNSIYGESGIIIGSFLYSFPVAFLMFSDVIKYEDYSQYEAANVLGISKTRQFFSITLPYLRKPLISIIFATFTLIVTDYGVPLAVGGQVKTLPVLLYEDAVGQLNYLSGAVIGIILLLPAVIEFLFDLFNKDKSKSSFVTRSFENNNSKLKNIVAYIICSIVSLFTLLIVISFCIQAFTSNYPIDMTFSLKHFENAISKKLPKFLINSILIALFTSIFGVFLALTTAYFTSRVKTKYSKILHLISIVSLAIPGLVLGLSYVILFKKSFIYGTIIMLIMVNTVHFFASPYLMMYNAFNKLNENLESVGEILGISRFRIVVDVIIPQCKETLIEMFSYFFVNCMITISAVSFLSTSSNKPLSLMINQFEAYNMIECAAVVAITILFVNIVMKTIVYFIKNRINKKSTKV